MVLGQSGLLGQAVKRRAALLGDQLLGVDRRSMPNLELLLRSPQYLISELNLSAGDLVLNAIGKTKQMIDETDEASKKLAHWLNSELPISLSNECNDNDIGYIQIGTDCVFSGKRGAYTESDVHDAEDYYGRTKSIGESGGNVNVVRTSFVGPSETENPGLWGWIEGQPPNSSINGYINHFWNGVTTDLLAKLVVNGFQEEYVFHGVQHFVPADAVTKHQLVSLIANRLGRNDLTVKQLETSNGKNMTLSTRDPDKNNELWNLAGYDSAARIADLINTQVSGSTHIA